MARPKAMTPDAIMEYFAQATFEDMLAFQARLRDALLIRSRYENKTLPPEPVKRVRKAKAKEPSNSNASLTQRDLGITEVRQ